MGKLIRKHMKTMISTLKSLILINFVKKNRLAAGPLPGVTLGDGQPPAARCAGAKMRKKNSNFFENTLPILMYNRYDIIPTIKNVHGQKINVHGH